VFTNLLEVSEHPRAATQVMYMLSRLEGICKANFVLRVDSRGAATKWMFLHVFCSFKSRRNTCKKVTESQRFGEISRLGNVKKNESDKWSG
jgi:hypothetical protein